MDIRKKVYILLWNWKQNIKQNFGTYFAYGPALMEFFGFSFFHVKSLFTPPYALHLHSPYTPLLKLFKEKLPPRASLKKKVLQVWKVDVSNQQIFNSCIRPSAKAFHCSDLTLAVKRPGCSFQFCTPFPPCMSWSCVMCVCTSTFSHWLAVAPSPGFVFIHHLPV